MSRTRRGSNGLKGKHMDFKRIKRASNSKIFYFMDALSELEEDENPGEGENAEPPDGGTA